MTQLELADTVARWLPEGVELRIRHLTHPQTECDPIFSPPPGEQPELTHFQSHFFLVSIRHDGENTEASSGTDSCRELLVFAIEVLVYTTAQLTTVFVSKADSTGYLYLLSPSKKNAPVIRNVSTAFLSHLARVHQRPGVRLVLSLFARAQNQYLFPGSSENAHKHILDDRGLIKWWCRAFDPILRTFEPEIRGEHKDSKEAEKTSATAHLIVPGCDKWETKGFFPPTSAFDDNQRQPRWVNSYPLNQISAFPTAPARCLVPRFPDDPKARFLMDLDEEIPESSQLGQWHSVKTLDQFWELMAFRQECSAGRLVGFLWLVVNPPGVLNSQGIAARTVPTIESSAGLSEESQSQPRSTPTEQPTVSVTADAPPIASLETYGEESQEPVASAATTIETVFEQSVTPGVDSKTILLSYQDYGTATELLTQLDFADEELALASTTSMFGKLSDLFGESIQCETVAGRWKPKVEPAASPEPITSPSKMNVLGSGFIRKRKRAEPLQGTSSTPGSEKPSLNGSVATATDGNLAADTAAPNLLQVRKKNKPTS